MIQDEPNEASSNGTHRDGRRSDAPEDDFTEGRASEHFATEAHPLLQVDSLTKLFALPRRWLSPPRFHRVVDDVSLYVMAGETLGIVGESGCGKTTLARCILRLLAPDFGQVAFDGENITDLNPRALRPIRRRMQPIFQDPHTSLDPELSIGRIVGEGLEVAAAGGSIASDAITHWLNVVGLNQEFINRKPRSLSAGERQRVAIARAMATRPALVVCDEPLSALDVSTSAQMVNLLLDLQSEYDIGYLFISHDVRLVRYLSHRMAVMMRGAIVETGPSERVYECAAHPQTRALVSSVFEPRADADHVHLALLPESEPRKSEQTRLGVRDEGCSLFARCARAESGKCDVQRPLLREVAPNTGHWVACHHPHDESLASTAE